MERRRRIFDVMETPCGDCQERPGRLQCCAEVQAGAVRGGRWKTGVQECRGGWSRGDLRGAGMPVAGKLLRVNVTWY